MIRRSTATITWVTSAGHDTTYTKFTGSPEIPNTDYVLQITTPQFSKFDLTFLEIGGRDENFFEWSAADI